MRRIFIGIAVAVALAGCGLAGADVRGSGKPTQVRRDVGRFTAITVGGAMDLEVEVGKATSVEVIGDDNIVPLVRTRLRGDRLVIDSRGSYQPKTRLLVRVTTPALTALAANGSGDCAVRGARGDELSLALNGSGSIDVAGTVERLRVELAGSGNVDATALAATSVRAELAGSGNIDLTARRALDAQLTGSGNIRYGGAPTQVERQITGSGTIEPR